MLSLAAQELSFKPKVEYFSFPNSELNTDEITDIQTDRDGYVWIISFSSIYKYNGHKFKKLESKHIDHGSFLRFHESPNGRKFVIDYLGSLYFIKNDKLEPFADNLALRKVSTHPKSTHMQFDKQGVLHTSSQRIGYHVQLRDRFKRVTPSVDFRGFGVRFLDDYPFYFSNGKFYKKNTKGSPVQFVLLDTSLTLIDSITIEQKRTFTPVSLVKLANGNFLFSTGKGSIIEFNQNRIIREVIYPDLINRLFTDKNNNLWISTLKKGIHFYKNAKINYQEKVTVLDKTTSFVSAQDYQGGLWFYTEGKGLGYMANPKMDYSNEIEDLVIHLSKNKLYYASNKTIWQYNEKSNSTKRYATSKHKNPILSLFELNPNKLLVASHGELSQLENEKTTPIHSIKLHDVGSGFRSFFLNRDIKDSSLIVGITRYEYFVYDPAEDTAHVSEIMPSFQLGAMKKGDTLWLKGTNGLRLMKDYQEVNLETDFPYRSSHVRYSKFFMGKPFFSFVGKGIYYFAQNNFIEIQYKGLSLLDCKLALEGDSLLWAFSNDASFTIRPSKTSPSGFETKSYPPLPRVAIKKLESNKKYLYLITQHQRIAKIAFNDIRKSKPDVPNVIIHEVKTQDSTYYPPTKAIELAYAKRSIEFNFECLDFQNLNLSYRYKLSGLEDSWKYTSSNLANYASIPAGTYNFLVQSRFGLGDWSEATSFQLTVITPFWQQAWFIILGLLFILFLSAQIIAYRYKVIYKEQKLTIERMRSEQKAIRALMTPHYIFNFIASLQYLIEEETKQKASRFLELFASSMRNILKQSDTNFISVENEVGFLKEYIEMEQFRLEDCFVFKIEVDKSIQPQDLIPTFIIQPFVENAIQHGLKAKGENGKLNLSFKKEKDFLKVSVKDNGVGRNQAALTKNKTGSYSINLIKRRLKIHNGKEENVFFQDLTTENNKVIGTEVILLIKLQSK
ncbi:MAG: histidine kinase [Vicingaceae bacterium]